MTDAELPRDDWSDVRRTVSLRSGWNEVEIRAAQQLEVLRLTGYSLTSSDLPSGWPVVYEDGYYAVLSPSASAVEPPSLFGLRRSSPLSREAGSRPPLRSARYESGEDRRSPKRELESIPGDSV